VTDQGLVQGRAHETVPYRDQFAPDCAILADVRVKHAAPLVDRPIGEEAQELLQRAAADAVIISGSATGKPVDLEELQTVRQSISSGPLLIGSGATPKRLPEILPHVDGLIVGSYLKSGRNPDNPVDPQRAAQFVQAVRAFPRSL
ncbi:MAG: hypothetical protein KC609_15520, partial [Myxococcales bacterium]|nr:hypothetical protein [Myxococcales bacterium]